mmetsp:Transcript_122566/g.225885  ORF Transcript_122566/g.225885 Transcript_122566/m.225885 type:complete len:99 (+) Transcript_122566:456-752(+)
MRNHESLCTLLLEISHTEAIRWEFVARELWRGELRGRIGVEVPVEAVHQWRWHMYSFAAVLRVLTQENSVVNMLRKMISVVRIIGEHCPLDSSVDLAS